MALETLGFVNDKTAIILDIGNAYTKCGIAGEISPRFIIPSLIDAQSKEGKPTLLYDITDSNILHGSLKEFLQHLFSRQLLTNARERRIVVVESPLSTTLFRNTLAKVLFEFFQVASVVFVPCHVMVLYTLGVRTALVMDIGYSEASVLPIYENMPLLNAWQSAPLCARTIHGRLESHLLEEATVLVDGREQPLSSVTSSLSNAVLEDIAVRCCFVTKMTRARQIQSVHSGQSDKSEMPPPPPCVEYPMDGQKIMKIPGTIREETCELLFDCQGHEESSLASLLLDAILEAPMDARRALAENIVVVGGVTLTQGLRQRLKCELDELVMTPKYATRCHLRTFKFHAPPAKENYTAWLGAAIFGHLPVLATRSVSREAYVKSGGVMADWCAIREKDAGTTVAAVTGDAAATSSTLTPSRPGSAASHLSSPTYSASSSSSLVISPRTPLTASRLSTVKDMTS